MAGDKVNNILTVSPTIGFSLYSLLLERIPPPIDTLFVTPVVLEIVFSSRGLYKNSSEHQLNEIKFAIDKLHEKSLVLLDDKGQKTNLSIKFMIENKFKVINETKNQVLLSF